DPGGQSMRALAVFVAALLMLGSVGCAHRASLPTAPLPTAAMEPKPDIGTVGLVVWPDPWIPMFQGLGAVGAAQGAKAGAKTGAVAPLLPGLFLISLSLQANEPNSFVLGLYLTGAGLVLAPVGAVVGAVAGALAVPSMAEVEQSMAALQRACSDISLPDALTAWIIDAGGGRGDNSPAETPPPPRGPLP